MRKLVSLILATVMLLTLCACGGADNSSSDASSEEKSNLTLGNEFFEKNDYLTAISYYTAIPFNDPDHKEAQTQLEKAKKLYIDDILKSTDELAAEHRYGEAVEFIDAARKTVSSSDFVSAKEKYISEFTAYVKTEGDKLFNSEGLDAAVSFVESQMKTFPYTTELDALIKGYKSSSYTYLIKDLAPAQTMGEIEFGTEAKVDIHSQTHGGTNSINVRGIGNGTVFFDLGGKYKKLGATVLLPAEYKTASKTANVTFISDVQNIKEFSVHAGFETKSFEVDITDTKVLKIRINNTGTTEKPCIPYIVDVYVIE